MIDDSDDNQSTLPKLIVRKTKRIAIWAVGGTVAVAVFLIMAYWAVSQAGNIHWLSSALNRAQLVTFLWRAFLYAAVIYFLPTKIYRDGSTDDGRDVSVDIKNARLYLFYTCLAFEILFAQKLLQHLVAWAL